MRTLYAFTEVTHMAQRGSQTTTDHDTIRRWAEERGGTPAEVESTARGDETGIIRIDFPGFSGEGKLKPISWEEWFQKFDASGLALVYQETTARGQRSNFNKLVARETAEARPEGRRTSRRAGGRASARGRTASRAGGAARRRSGGSATARGGKRAASSRTGASRGGTRATGRREASRGMMASARSAGGRGGAKTSARGSTASRRGGGRKASTSRRGGSAGGRGRGGGGGRSGGRGRSGR